MRRSSFQPTLNLADTPSKVSCAARDSAHFSPWPKNQRESEVARAVAEVIAAMLHVSKDRSAAEKLPRMMEDAILASGAGPEGTSLLEQVDRALCQARGRDHGLLDGKYA